ncbi:MAG TPA: chromate efflux transporter, partial [Solirubrobacteraceae bacterium]
MTAEPGALREVVALFLKLGVIGFGGPAAHIALMRDEVVRRRRWIADDRFLDLLGMTNLIPGPNSTEMAIHLGYLRAGWPGLVAGGVCFIVPAMVSVLAFAWAYVRYGSRPEVAWLLYGIKPVIIAVVVQAVWSLGRAAVKGPLAAAVGLAVLVLYLLGVDEIALLFGGAVVFMLLREGGRRWLAGAAAPVAVMVGGASVAVAQVAAAGGAGVTLTTLFLTFLKIGSVLYGSGYVLLAFLRNDFVVRLGWLTDRQLIDAVAVGQFTPGPVFTTATFVGYVLGSWWGAVLATIAIFLPSFVLVAASYPLLP